jgi:non-ribosomal peptide synthetase component F/thioesterase domain-containing protein/acyl carrier protein
MAHSSRGDTRTDLPDGALDMLRTSTWLEDDRRPLDWNGPANRHFTLFRDQDLQRPIIEHFERVVRRHRGRIAIREGVTALTFGELWSGVSGLAETLAAEAKPGDLIGILLPACPMFPLAILACLASGRPFVALDTHSPPDWLHRVLRDARPRVIITLDDGFRDVEARMPTERVIRLTRLPGSACGGWRPAAMAVDNPACVLFTSGSTGLPKSIVNSQRNLLQRVAQSINAAHINAADRLLTLASPCTIVGVRDVMTALLAGASIHLFDPQGVGAREILNVIRAETITILFAFPALLRSIVAAREGCADASLRLVRVGGDTTVWSDIEMLRAWLVPEAAIQLLYAATEAPMMQWFVDDRCRRDDARVPIGYPLPGNRLAIVDAEGRATPPGEVGELIAASPYVSLGRWVEGRLANEGVESGGGCGWRIFRTGDLVRQRPDGLLERVGRKDRQVKIAGARVDLDGIEAMLRGHSFVRDVAVVARPDSTESTLTLVAYISARNGAPTGLIDELKALMRSAPPPMRPARFYLEPSIPRLPNSKLDFRALAALDEAHVQRERAESIDEAQLATMAGDHISQTVARVWQHVLLVPVRAAEDDFFDSGGDSLKAITFVLELERALGLEISLTLINEAPRFDQLCQALRERRAPGSTLLVTLKAGDGLPPVFFIHGVGGNVVEILPAARRMTYAGAVIGIRARGAVRGEVPHRSIEAMAADYLREIKERQPKAPYYLCGYSSGGLVAFEMARRLSDSGDEVGLVGLFDTTMSPVRWPLRAWLSIIARRIAFLAAALRAPIRTWPATLRKSAERLRAWRVSIGAATSIAIRVAASALIASAKYRPGFYPGTLTLFSPAGRESGLPSLESIWRKHARTVVVVETAGTHSTMLSPRHAEMTAACVTRCLPAGYVSSGSASVAIPAAPTGQSAASIREVSLNTIDDARSVIFGM